MSSRDLNPIMFREVEKVHDRVLAYVASGHNLKGTVALVLTVTDEKTVFKVRQAIGDIDQRVGMRADAEDTGPNLFDDLSPEDAKIALSNVASRFKQQDPAGEDDAYAVRTVDLTSEEFESARGSVCGDDLAVHDFRNGENTGGSDVASLPQVPFLDLDGMLLVVVGSSDSGALRAFKAVPIEDADGLPTFAEGEAPESMFWHGKRVREAGWEEGDEPYVLAGPMLLLVENDEAFASEQQDLETQESPSIGEAERSDDAENHPNGSNGHHDEEPAPETVSEIGKRGGKRKVAEAV